ncbi:tyrosine-type recombinase/integrase [Ferrimonas pelagia]|uniref:Site-specific integrase n=1 Tax=Ferrimonas pelagia TaxID=1177826 RepID=A0ABP9ELN0_9GAMM
MVRRRDIYLPQNLYATKRANGRTYFQWRDPRTARFHGMGSDPDRAIADAVELNRLVQEQVTSHLSAIIEQTPMARKARGITTGDWLDRYMEIQEQKQQTGELKPNTIKTRRSLIKIARHKWALLPLKSIDTKAVFELLEEVKSEGKHRTASALRSTLIDVFIEAGHRGELEGGHNPAAATKGVRVKVERSRLTWDDAKVILAEADKRKPWCGNAMRLALVTAQRVSDIHALQFANVEGDFLKFEQAKTGTRLALPLALHLDVLGMSLGDVISQCRDRVLSRHLIHHTRNSNNAPPGAAVHQNTISRSFQLARNESGLSWEGTPPSFHELRSLSARLYHEQGIDTQTLLGHKDPRMTEKYRDSRGVEYITLAV